MNHFPFSKELRHHRHHPRKVTTCMLCLPPDENPPYILEAEELTVLGAFVIFERLAQDGDSRSTIARPSARAGGKELLCSSVHTVCTYIIFCGFAFVFFGCHHHHRRAPPPSSSLTLSSRAVENSFEVCQLRELTHTAKCAGRSFGGMGLGECLAHSLPVSATGE